MTRVGGCMFSDDSARRRRRRRRRRYGGIIVVFSVCSIAFIPS